jgi:hypothetical protein
MYIVTFLDGQVIEVDADGFKVNNGLISFEKEWVDQDFHMTGTKPCGICIPLSAIKMVTYAAKSDS